LLASQFILKLLLLRVNFSPRDLSLTKRSLAILWKVTYFFVFQALDTGFFTHTALSIDGVGPVFNSVLAGLVESLAVIVAHRNVRLHILLAHLVLYALKLVHRYHD